MKTIRSAILNELQSVSESIAEEQISSLLDELMAAPRIFGLGAGRSGLIIKAFIMRLMQAGRPAFVVGETVTPAIGANDLLVIGSSSGQTATIIEMAKSAKSANARIALITASPRSDLAVSADRVVDIPVYVLHAPAGRSIQPPGSTFEQAMLLVLDALVPAIMERMGVSDGQLLARHANLQ